MDTNLNTGLGTFAYGDFHLCDGAYVLLVSLQCVGSLTGCEGMSNVPPYVMVNSYNTDHHTSQTDSIFKR